MFYAGVWASNLDFGGDFAGNDIANIEIDLYAGIKPKTGRITWDLGVIYYAYPELERHGRRPRQLNYVEFKVGGSAEIWKGGTLGVTVLLLAGLYQLRPATSGPSRAASPRRCRRSACSPRPSAP